MWYVYLVHYSKGDESKLPGVVAVCEIVILYLRVTLGLFKGLFEARGKLD